MAIHVVCPNGHQLRVAEKYFGKRARCPKCRRVGPCSPEAADTLAAARWYSKHFGSKPTKAGQFDAVVHGKTTVKFKEGKSEFEGSVGTVVDHIGFSVPDARAKMKELEQEGVQIVAPPAWWSKLHGRPKAAILIDDACHRAEIGENMSWSGGRRRAPVPVKPFFRTKLFLARRSAC